MNVRASTGILVIAGLAVALAGPTQRPAWAGDPVPDPTPTPCPYQVPDPETQPVFTGFLNDQDPRDRLIAAYWEKVRACEATPEELVDLGTLLFERNFPRDALRMFERAVELDGEMYEAWFRAGMVHHSMGELKKAKKAYRKCLKIFKGHGWCNFYLGLAEEQSGSTSGALHYYRKAFKYAPALADPKVNPAVLQSRLQLGAFLKTSEAEGFKTSLPMELLKPGKLEAESAVSAGKNAAAPAAPRGGARTATGPAKTVQPRVRATPVPVKPAATGAAPSARPTPRPPMRRVPRVPPIPTASPPGSSAASMPPPLKHPPKASPVPTPAGATKEDEH